MEKSRSVLYEIVEFIKSCAHFLITLQSCDHFCTENADLFPQSDYGSKGFSTCLLLRSIVVITNLKCNGLNYLVILFY